MDELLKIVIAEYKQMTGLEDVAADTKVINLHTEPLKKRLSMNGGFLIFKDSVLYTVGDFAKAIDTVFAAYNNYAMRVLQIAKVLTGKEYSVRDELFGDYCLGEQYKYRYILCNKISDRYQIEFDETIDKLRSAEDFSNYIFKKVYVEKALV